MEYVFLLSKQNIGLSQQEAVNLLCLKTQKLNGNILVAETKNKQLFPRLAYTKKVLLHLFDCNVKDLEKNMERFNWSSVYEKDFSLRVHNSSTFKEADLAGYVWNKVKNPKVNLKNPNTKIELYFLKKKVYCGTLLWRNEEKFDERKPHLRPELIPTSLHPRLARCCVNLTAIKGNKTLIDPFCGTGGILIEAGLMGIKAVGSDINQVIVRKCQRNLKSFKLSIEVKQQDATKIKEKFDCVVTDLPYGKNTGKADLEKLYSDFLRTLKRILKKRAVIIFPDSIDYKKLIKKTKLKIEQEFSYYIHKSMTKKIVVIKK